MRLRKDILRRIGLIELKFSGFVALSKFCVLIIEHVGVVTILVPITLGDPDLELRGEVGGGLIYLPDWLFSLLSFLLFYPK